MNDHCSYFIDGSYLFASIARVQHDHSELQGYKLNVQKLAQHLQGAYSAYIGSSIRVTYYFREGDPRIKTHLTIPDLHGSDGHWQIKECGSNLRGVNEIPASELDKLSPQYRDIYPRAEKGVDMELACDALTLAANASVQCFVFMINDRDYLPLLKTLQRFGANTYLAGLDVRQKMQDAILKLADHYATVEGALNDIFDYTPAVTPAD